jgi:hypothetical protein
LEWCVFTVAVDYLAWGCSKYPKIHLLLLEGIPYYFFASIGVKSGFKITELYKICSFTPRFLARSSAPYRPP